MKHLYTPEEYLALEIEHYARQDGDQWLLSTATGLEGSIAVASIGCTLRLSEVYEKVTFPTGSEPG